MLWEFAMIALRKSQMLSKWMHGLLQIGSDAFMCLLLIFVGGFSLRQGIVLGVLMGTSLSMIVVIGIKALKPIRRFTPYWVCAEPKWCELLTDFKLITGPEEWNSILESLEKSTDYSVLLNGLLFTVVQQSEDFDDSLIYVDGHKAFISEFRFSEDMAPLPAERPEGSGLVLQKRTDEDIEPDLTPRFFMKEGGPSGLAGYRLGIEVREKWWERIKGSCPAPLEESTNHLCGSVELTLACLPYTEFDLYWGRAEWSEEFNRKTAQPIRKRRDESRQKLGWVDVDLHKYAREELGLSVPEHIEHKYFVVEHQAI
jgi:hypothetical protein